MPDTPTDDPLAERPLFSVVIPVFNRAREVQPTLLSVAGQTCADFECIIVDDGSIDGGALRRVIDSLNDTRFRYIRQENGGASVARNTGVRRARGDYIAFLDSDDLFLPNKLERVAEIARQYAGFAIYSRCYVNRGVGRFWIRPDRAIGEREDMADYLFVHNQFIPTPTLVVSRSVALTYQFDPTLKQIEDPDLWFRMHRGGIKFKMVDEPLVIWNDVAAKHRLSHVRGTEAPFIWLERWRSHLSREAELGYRATVLAYYLAPRHPLLALRDLFTAWLFAGVSSRVVLRQLLRGFLPSGIYRHLVNALVAVRGSRGTDPAEAAR